MLVESLVRLRELVPGVRLEIVGDGDDVAHLQARPPSSGSADLVDWQGAVDHAGCPQHYRRAGVTVLPSLTEAESFGMTLVEAMASGCPVVGSDVGGIPFVIRDGVDGLLVPPGRPGRAGRGAGKRARPTRGGRPSSAQPDARRRRPGGTGRARRTRTVR